MSTPLKILVVDDESGIREFLKIFLSGRNHQVTTADCGDAARNLLGVFDLVLTDLVMRSGNGLEVVREFQMRTPTPKICVMSGGGPEDMLDAVRALNVPLLDKPFLPGELGEFLHSHLQLTI